MDQRHRETGVPTLTPAQQHEIRRQARELEAARREAEKARASGHPSNGGWSPSGRAVAVLVVVAIAASLATVVGSASNVPASVAPERTFVAAESSAATGMASAPSSLAPLTEAESSLLASMTIRYDDCQQNQPPAGLRLADIKCSTIDGVFVLGVEYASEAAASDAIANDAPAEARSRCSAGAYFGPYRVRGEVTGQLACDGSTGLLAWTVPALRLHLSATNPSMPELYAWWKYHWTVGSVASGATTGEKAVPVPVDAEVPGPDATPAPGGASWPAEFATNLCIAIAEHSLFVDDLINLEAAAAAYDLDALSLHAYSLGADVLVIDTALSLAPAYQPAEEMIVAWREALAAFVPAFEDIDVGASDNDQARLDRGIRRFTEASILLKGAIPKVEAFRAETGFTC